MNLYKIAVLFLLNLISLTLFGQTKYDPIKVNVDKINPVYAIIERSSPRGITKEKILKTDKEGIQKIQEDKTLESIGYEFVNIDQLVTYWIKKEADGRNCCMGPENCNIWALSEMKLVYTDSIRLYKEQNLVHTHSKVFPNPVIDVLNINASSEILQIKIIDILAREVFQKNIESKNTEINIKHLESGNYIIQLELENEIRSHKFIKT